jgi:type I restriction enzyme, S subunit
MKYGVNTKTGMYRFKAYKHFKDSGIEWLGDVPEHWNLLKIGKVCKLQGGYAFDSSLYGDEGAYLIQMSNLKSGSIELDENRKVPIDAIPKGFFLKANDLLYGMSGSIGNYAVVPDVKEILALNQRVGRFHSYFDLLGRYLLYFIQSNTFDTQVRLMMTGTAQFNISSNQIHRIDIALPYFNEQKAIAAFLDRETARIDALIEKKEKLIELLKEKRIALITQAVTKGLDPNAPMKDSGIEWLGEVPEHWEIKKFKHNYTASMGNTILKEDLSDEASVPVYSATELVEVFGFIDNPCVVLHKYDFIIPARGNSIGHVKLVQEKCTCTQTTIYAKRMQSNTMNPKYAYWYQIGFRKMLFAFDNTAIPQLTVRQVKENPIIEPPYQEQYYIASFIDKETAKIDDMTKKISQTITLLSEYRASLINAAVTGKIDVRSQA